MNDSIKSAIVLTAICLVVTLLLGVLNYITAPIIAEANKAATLASFYKVLPEAEDFEEVEMPAGAPETVQSIYKDTAGTGYAISLATSSQYSSSDMLITVGIGADGIIKNVVLTSYTESKDFGADYPSTYIGQDSSLSGVDIVAGVTYSSTAFKNAVQDAYTALFTAEDAAAGEKSDAQTAKEAQ